MVNEVRQGEVYWLDFGEETSSAPGGRHPCLAVQNDLFNRSSIATTVICLITSNLKRTEAPGNVLLRRGEANLPKASVVNVSQVLTVDKSDLRECAGEVGPAARQAVRSGLRLLFSQMLD